MREWVEMLILGACCVVVAAITAVVISAMACRRVSEQERKDAECDHD